MFEEVFRQIITRESNSNKYDFGHALVLGGAPGMVGAPMLCALGALRTGAGLVTITSSKEVTSSLEKRVLEIMTLALEGTVESQNATVLEFVVKRRINVFTAGTGFDVNHIELIKKLLPNLNIPIVLDAGAFTCFASCKELLKEIASHNHQIICTPHEGEFEKFVGNALPENLQDRKSRVEEIAHQINCTVVCKGASTIISIPENESLVIDKPNPGLSSAGTGDVLAGIITGLLAQNVDYKIAAQAGVYLHALSGELATLEKTQAGVIASDVIESIPSAIKSAAS